MVIPQSLIVVLLLGALGMCLRAHYRIIRRPDAPLFGLPMRAAVVMVLLLFAFLLLQAFAPGWGLLRPVFLGLGVAALIVAFLVRGGARKFLSKSRVVHIRHPETGVVHRVEIPPPPMPSGKKH